MATIHKLTKDGATIFPATLTDAVVHPQTGKTLTSMIKDYNVSELFPTEGIDGGNKYSLALAIQVLGTHLSAAQKTGGIRLTFISSVSPSYSEEEYVQYRLMATTWSTNISDWQGVDDEPTAGSDNLVKSGGVKEAIDRSIEIVNETLSEYQPIQIEGDVTNAPDEEDLTSENVEGTDVLKFKNKAYSPIVFSGLGRVYLRKNIQTIGGEKKNVLTRDMFYKGEVGSRVPNENTIFIIQYDYDLNGTEVTIPEGSVLQFDGGSVRNGTLIGNGTKIISSYDSIFSSIIIEGTWDCPYITSKWFEDASDNNVLKQVFNLSSDDIYNSVVIEEGNYSVSITDTDDEEHPILKIKSNTHLHILGTITLAANNSTHYSIFNILHKDNITIDGGGTIIGDKEIHIGKVGEHGHGIFVRHGSNINISGLTVEDCWGDCLCIGTNTNTGVCENVTVKDCTFTNGRRQGISVICAQNCSVERCNIYNIYGTPPSACIDIEPNRDGLCKNIVISNCILSGAYGILITRLNTSEGGNCILEDIFIRNNNIACIDISYTEDGESKTLAGDYALRAQCAQNLFITDNVIMSVKEGINLSRNSFKTVVENNIIKTSDTALFVGGPDTSYPYFNQERYVSITNNYLECTSTSNTEISFIGVLNNTAFSDNKIVAGHGVVKILGNGCTIHNTQITSYRRLNLNNVSEIKNCKLDVNTLEFHNGTCKIDGCNINASNVLSLNECANSTIRAANNLFLYKCINNIIVCSRMIYVCGQVKYSDITCPCIEFTGSENNPVNSDFSFNEVYFTKNDLSYAFTSPFRVENYSQHTSIYNNTLTIGEYTGNEPGGYYDLLLSSAVSFNFYNNTIIISSDSAYSPPGDAYALLYVRTTNRDPEDPSDRGSYIEGNPVININNNIVNNKKESIKFNALFADVDERKIVVGNFLCPTEGTSNERPKTVWTGAQFFDSDLGKPIYFKVVYITAYTYSWVDALGNSVDTEYIKTSVTAGLVKNDGTIDTNIYLTEHQDISGKMNIITGGTAGNVPMITNTGQLKDSGKAASNITNA